MKIRVYVVMGNDYPEAVFSNEAAADKFIEKKRAEDRREDRPWPNSLAPRIYWRHYEYEVRDQ